MRQIRLLIVDDDPLARFALTSLLSADSGIEVVGEASTGEEALDRTARENPDIVLMDLRMPGIGGTAATAEIAARWPSTRVVVLTTLGTREAILPALQAGAAGYLLKDAPPTDMIAAIRAIDQGTAVLSGEVNRRLISSIEADQRVAEPLSVEEALTVREADIVQLLAAGMSNLEIAGALHLSEATVKGSLSKVMSKWRVRDRVQVLLRAARAGVIQID